MAVNQDMTSYNQNTTGDIIVWNPKLADTYLKRNTFFSLVGNLGMGRHPTANQKFNWGEYTDSVTSFTTDSGGGTGTLEDAGTGWKSLIKDDVLYCPEVDTYAHVDTTPSTSSISANLIDVTSGAATDIAANLTSADYAAGLVYYKIGSMKEDGSFVTDSNLDSIAFAKDIDNSYNYCQTFEDWVKISKGAAANEWHFSGMTRYEHQRAVKMQKHINDIERTMWKGVQVVDGDSTHGRYGTRGFFNFQSIQSETGTMAGFDWNDFISFTQLKVMAENEKEELNAFVNPYMLTQVAEWAEATAHITFDGNGKEDRFGIRVYELVSPHVVLKLRRNRALKDLYPSKAVMACIDLDRTGLRHHAGNGFNYNTTMETRVEPKRANFYLDKIYSELGFELHNAGNHSYLLLS